MLRDLAMFNIGYLCGLRVSEIGRLHQEYFNEPGGELFCTRLKNSISNTIRLDDKRKNLLKKHIRESQVKNGDPLGQPHFFAPTGPAEQYAGKAKLPEDKAHWHTLKHSIAVHLAESGADVKELQNYLGHKKIDSTMVYFQFTTKQQDAFYKKIAESPQIV